MKIREGNCPHLKGGFAGFACLPHHLSRLGACIELYWLALPIAGIEKGTTKKDDINIRSKRSIDPLS